MVFGVLQIYNNEGIVKPWCGLFGRAQKNGSSAPTGRFVGNYCFAALVTVAEEHIE